MQFRITWMAVGLMMAAVASHAAIEPSAAPEAVVRQQAYRCLDGAGRVQYQQQACAPDKAQEAIQVRDDRTRAQQSQAQQHAQRDQDLARQLTSTRHKQERQDQDANAHARNLTMVTHRPATAAHRTTLAESQHLISRKRDFRAVSAKTAKATKNSKQAKASGKTKSTRQQGRQAG